MHRRYSAHDSGDTAAILFALVCLAIPAAVLLVVAGMALAAG